ncbi:lasso peptide biosynthesis B2 protein [Robbsia andropogonis]|uniref:lasso peptide biosynthesis B2 protein n=1 Tax=Robbsia andropogonis TaxID=28092 RepID=UPI0006982D02|nr:lasso peptide biosynthesis B2 protein [Robbsia andropogonis]
MYRHLQAGIYIAPLCEGMAILTMHDDQYFLLNEAQARALLHLLGVGTEMNVDAATVSQWTGAFERQGLLRAGTFDAPDAVAAEAAARKVAPLAGFTGWRLDPDDIGPGLPLWLIARAWWAVRQSHRITARTRMPGLMRWLYGAPHTNLSYRIQSNRRADAAAAFAGSDIHARATPTALTDDGSAPASASQELFGASARKSAPDVSLHAITRARIAQSVCALNRACLLYPRRTKCLEWSAALVHLCQRRGVDVDLVIGVSGGPFSAHAWVEHDGMVMGDDAERRRQFAVIVDGRMWRNITPRPGDTAIARRNPPGAGAMDTARRGDTPRDRTRDASPAGA